MDSLEKALRNALAKGAADDPAFRLKVYTAAERALQKTIESGIDAESAMERRRHLASVVGSIEAGYAGPDRGAGDQPKPADAVARPVPTPSIELADDHPSRNDVTGIQEPARKSPPHATPPPLSSAGDRPAPRAGRVEPTVAFEPTLVARPSHKPDPEISPAAMRAGPPGHRRRRRPYAIAFAAVVLLACLAVGTWWAIDTGAFLTAEQRDTSVPNPPAQLEEEGFAPTDGSEAPAPAPLLPTEPLEDGSPVLTPSDPTNVALFGGAAAELVADGAEQFLRVTPGGADSGVAVEIGQGILRRMSQAGGTVLLVARASGETQAEIALTCAFGTGGDCGRQRFTIVPSLADYLFSVEASEVGSSPASGKLVLTFGNGGAPIDIRSVSVIPGD